MPIVIEGKTVKSGPSLSEVMNSTYEAWKHELTTPEGIADFVSKLGLAFAITQGVPLPSRELSNVVRKAGGFIGDVADTNVSFNSSGTIAYSRYPRVGFFKSKYPDKFGKVYYYRKLPGISGISSSPATSSPATGQAILEHKNVYTGQYSGGAPPGVVYRGLGPHPIF